MSTSNQMSASKQSAMNEPPPEAYRFSFLEFFGPFSDLVVNLVVFPLLDVQNSCFYRGVHTY